MSANSEQPATPPSAARIGRWMIPAIPFGWTWVPDFGIQKATQGGVPSNVYLREDLLLNGDQLAPYLDRQITLMKSTFVQPVVAGPAPLAFPGADEAAMLMLRHKPMQQVSVFQVQHYMRCQRWIGIATLTTLESELLAVRADFDQFMKMLSFAPAQG